MSLNGIGVLFEAWRKAVRRTLEENAVVKPKSRYEGYDVKFFPTSGYYYPRYKRRPLQLNEHGQIVWTTLGDYHCAKSFSNEQEAWRFIDRAINEKEPVVFTRNDT